ncbi:MAG: hypothetical protein ACTHQQ_12540 [Solirubrobacteraceae bacterium]
MVRRALRPQDGPAPPAAHVEQVLPRLALAAAAKAQPRRAGRVSRSVKLPPGKASRHPVPF